MSEKLVYRGEFFKEGETYVGIAVGLNVSSFGATLEEARASLHEAVEAFVEECEAMGTLDTVMEEAGFVRDGDQWLSREPVMAERLTTG